MLGKRTPEEVAKALEKGTPDDEASRAGSKGASEVESRLAGMEVSAAGAEARGGHERLEGGAASSRPPASLAQVRSLRPPRPRSMVPWIAAAAAVVLVGGGWLYERLSPSQPEFAGDHPHAPATLRRAAFDACQAAHWQDCIDRFDEARSLDPPGDADPLVQAERTKAIKALGVTGK